ncbi:hypothetical protein Y1Q_0020002 [Alligator mississippiensis]|uniref:Uncharacterized protein n=1 Tax=Alligator mississippiensis TaxID=8496 RepID=A0A151LYP7_ALLMI|nr:hypothetical protein Y1Q_0020002 [Alligator mississippiensis]
MPPVIVRSLPRQNLNICVSQLEKKGGCLVPDSFPWLLKEREEKETTNILQHLWTALLDRKSAFLLKILR